MPGPSAGQQALPDQADYDFQSGISKHDAAPINKCVQLWLTSPFPHG